MILSTRRLNSNGFLKMRQESKIVVDIDKEIDVATAAEQELSRRLKALGALRIMTDRGLELGDVAIIDISATFEQDESTPKTIPSAESKAFQFDTEDGDGILPKILNSITGSLG